MSAQKLRITYHPAKKEVGFQRFGTNGNQIAIRDDSVLFPYMQEKGKFILQDHGDSFFDDIAKAFDGEEHIQLEAVMTKNDFEDLKQMIEHYTEGKDIRITATLLAELPDMRVAYDAVRRHGEKSISILTDYRKKFFEIDSTAETVKQSIADYAKKLNEVSGQIQEKIDAMKDNNIDLCFAGVYSSGKSALINALLGYRILPEAISSKTAHMFTIQSPKNDEPVRVCFFIGPNMAELLWDSREKCFFFGASPSENQTRSKIQDVINKIKTEPQHAQLYRILEELNENSEVNDDIDIFFPVPLDQGRLRFTIYDTPGSDSNYAMHKLKLEEALSSQTNSILIFVTAPNKLEGEGNNALLSYIQEAEKKGTKTNIDIDRSIFVMNYIDGQSQKNCRDLQHSVLKQKDSLEDDSSGLDDGEKVEIKLGNKKLLFTSAKYAYAARAVQNGIAGDEEMRTMKYRFDEVCDAEDGRFYQYDRVATSECARDRLLTECKEAMEVAIQKGDKPSAMWIGSGVYALDWEIRTYGEKYAGAVKTAAIIESVDNALNTMSKSARSLEEKNQAAIDKLDNDIEALRKALRDAIKSAREKYEIKNNQLKDEDLEALHLDQDGLLSDITEPAESVIDKVMGWLAKRLHFDLENKNKKKKICNQIGAILGDFNRKYRQRREALLTSQRDSYIVDIRKAIEANGSISEEAKRYICDITPPDVHEDTNSYTIAKAYEKNVQKVILDIGIVQVNKFKVDVVKELGSIMANMKDEYTEDYTDTLNRILNKIQTEFDDNIDRYSRKVQAMIQDKDAMEKLRSTILEAEDKLSQCKEELNDTIWAPKRGVKS